MAKLCMVTKNTKLAEKLTCWHLLRFNKFTVHEIIEYVCKHLTIPIELMW